MKKILLLIIPLFSYIATNAQFNTANIDGTISTNEYGTHSNGSNQQTNNLIWYMTWDNTNLYVAVANYNNSNDAMVFYIDHNPLSIVNGGSNTNGTLSGTGYDGLTTNLPFRADFFAFLKPGYDDYKYHNGSGGWGSSTINSLTKNYNSGNKVFEVAIPWNAVTNGSGRPSSFNFVCFGGYTTGLYAQIPSANPGGTISTVTLTYYQTILNTANTTATKPFSLTSYAANSGSAILTTGGTLQDFTLNGATASLTSAYNVNGNIAVTSGSTLTTGGNLTLTSNANGTANFINSEGTITGNITVQRYIPAKAARKWSFVASPISAGINSSWQNNTHITGNGTGGSACPSLSANSNGFDVTLTNAASMLVYDGNATAGNRWISVSNTNATNLTPGLGYRMNIRGPRSAGCSLLDGSTTSVAATTLSATGSLSAGVNKGTVNVNISTLGTGSDGYYLLGNPYPCVIDFNAFRSTNAASIANEYKTYSPANPAGTYTTWNGGTLVNAGDLTNGQYIASGQAFFVQNTVGGSVTLTFNENHKVANQNQPGTFRNKEWKKLIRISLKEENTHLDEIVVRFDEVGINDMKTDFDAYTINNGNQVLASLKGKDKLAIQTRNDSFNKDLVELFVSSETNGTFTLNFSEFENFENTTIKLIDRVLHTVLDVKVNATYTFVVTDANKALLNNRFALEFNRIKPGFVNSLVLNAYPNPTSQFLLLEVVKENTTVIITDLNGRILQQQKVAAGLQKINVEKFATGAYFISLVDEKEKQTVQFVKQ